MDYINGRCGETTTNFMGFDADPRYPGKFYNSAVSEVKYDGDAQYQYVLRRLGMQAADFLSFDFLTQ